MNAFLCQRMIDFDATEHYQADDIQQLVEQLQKERKLTVVIFRNAYYLTTKAFSILHHYLQSNSKNVVFVIESSDRSKIFPPILEYVRSNQ